MECRLVDRGRIYPACRDRVYVATRRCIWPLLGQPSGSWPFAAITLVSLGAHVDPAFPGAATVRRLPLRVEASRGGRVAGFCVLRHPLRCRAAHPEAPHPPWPAQPPARSPSARHQARHPRQPGPPHRPEALYYTALAFRRVAPWRPARSLRKNLLADHGDHC